MNPDMQRLIHACLDDQLTAEQSVEINRRIRTDPQFAHAFADAVYLHDRLFDIARTGREAGTMSVMKTEPGEARKPLRLPSPRRERVWAGIAAGITILLCGIWWNSSHTLSAATELDRLIAKVDATSDRKYEIRNLDATPEEKKERQPPIDGATLYVRNPDRYVLVRNYPDDRRFITGSDGRISWAVPPEGSVRISPDVNRFRGPVPGHQHGLPFVDLRGDLNAFRARYELSRPRLEPNGLRTISGTRKSGVPRGPRSFEMTYEPSSGRIRSMIFDGLPQARGGPRRVAVELIDSLPLPEGFFRHDFHHGIDREVVEEQ